MGKHIDSPAIGTIVKHTGWGFEDNENYPCDVLICDGEYYSDGRLSNYWYWQRVLPNGRLSKIESGYGSFEESEDNYEIITIVIKKGASINN